MNFMAKYIDFKLNWTEIRHKMLVPLTVFFCISCGKQDPSIQKTKLAGYWSIESVTSPDGNKSDCSIKATKDYLALAGGKGERTVVGPKFDGSLTYIGDSGSTA